jgi:hypothetical protein
MTSRQFVDFIEQKLAQHRIEKVIPADDVLEQHARRLIEQRPAEKAIEKLLREINANAAVTPLPADLRRAVKAKLGISPSPRRCTTFMCRGDAHAG